MKKKGFTLVELILSMAILGIIAIVVLNIFNTGLINIVRAGDITHNTNNASTDIDNKILNSTVGDDGISNNSVNVEIPGVSSSKAVPGKLIIQNTTDEKGNSITVKTFVPY